MKHPEVLVLGGGIIGLACARELSRRGVSVEVFEAGRVGAGASRAAAGMLSPLAESLDDQAFFEACRDSRDLWREWADELEAESDIDVDHDRAGALIIDVVGDGRVAKLQDLAAQANEPADLLRHDEVHALVPDLDDRVSEGLLIHGEHRVDNSRVCDALAVSLQRGGVRICEGHRVERVELDATHVKIVGDGWTREGQQLILATGSWSGLIEGLPELPITPVRGQMLELGDVSWPWTGSVWGPHHYAVRRAGDRLLLGATVEEAGFEAHPTPRGLEELLLFCRELFPSLTHKPLLSTWAGLRPASPDRLPIVGALGDPRLWVASGHFRNGILLAPWTALLLADQITGVADAHPSFSPQRFAATLSPSEHAVS